MAKLVGPATPGFAFNEERFERDIRDVLKVIDRIEAETNLQSEEMLDRLGSKAVMFATAHTKPTIKPSGFKNGSPAKRFKRKIIAQSKQTEQALGGIWYKKVGENTVKPRKGKKRGAKSVKLSQFMKKRKKKRADQNAPFFSPAAIPKAAKRGLKKTKVVIYRKGNRRANKWGMLPIEKQKTYKDRRDRVRNPGAGQLGWINAQRYLKYKDPKDAAKASKMVSPKNHKSRIAKSSVTKRRASLKKGAYIKLSNLVKYAGASSVNAKYGARRGTNSAIAWFKGYWLPKRMKENDRKWKSKYKRILA